MRKVIGIGETILDIIFKNDKPEKAVPGGSVFNTMVSLSRRGITALFISELGNDKVGRLIKDFMIENHLSLEYIDFLGDDTSPVSLAFLDEQQNASYQFYRDFPKKRPQIKIPDIQADDILILSSYFAVSPILRKEIVRMLTYAKQQKAIIYYDINFRKPHAGERLMLMPDFIENFKYSTIVRCSSEDLEVLFPEETIMEIYKKYISPYCKYFIVTQGEKEILLKTGAFEKNYSVETFVPVSTIGAGDNFNAGLIFGLMQEKILLDDLEKLTENQWDKLIGFGEKFASEVCRSMENYVDSKLPFILSK